MTFGANCVLSIAINFAGFMVVKVSSSLLLKVLGTVRNAFLILWGMQMYGEAVSTRSAAGYLITLLSFAMYTRAKMTPVRQEQAQEQKQEQEEELKHATRSPRGTCKLK